MDTFNDSHYSDSPEAPPPAKPSKPSDESAQTALAPRSLFPSEVEPGYRCQIEVVSVHSDEVEFRKVAHKEDAKEEAPEEMAMAQSTGDDYS